MRQVPMVMLLLGLASAMPAAEQKDKFDEYFEKAAAGLRNCGRVDVGGKNRASADECVLGAFKAGEPFFVRYDQLGDDSNVSMGLVFSRARRLVVVQFDDWFCSTPFCARPESCGSPRITKTKTGLNVQCSNEYEL